MYLNELFDYLSQGELSQVALGENMTSEDHQKLVGHINLGLTALHRRFKLREGRVTLPLTLGKETYPLAVETGQGGILQIERVLWPEALAEATYRQESRQVSPDLPLDAEGDPLSVFRTSLTTLRVPASLQELGVESLDVVFRQDHPRIVWEEGFFYPEEIPLELPASHLELLMLFVASRVMNPMGSAGGATDFHAGNNYATKYEQACQQLEQWGYQLKSDAETTRFERNGFT